MLEITLQRKLKESITTHCQKTSLKFYHGDRQQAAISFKDLDLDSNRAAHLFLGMGIGQGDRIIVCLPKSITSVIAYLAALKLTAVMVPLNPGFKKGELSYLIHDAQAKLALVGPSQNRLFRQIDPALPTIEIDPDVAYRKTALFGSDRSDDPGIIAGPEDPAMIIYTSGTTGDPKGAVLTQYNLVRDALNVINIWKITAADVLCHALPLFHIHGLCFALTTALLAGAETVMLDRFCASAVITHLSRTGEPPVCSIFMAVPSMYRALLNSSGIGRCKFDHLRLITSGSAPLLPQDFRRITKAFGQEPVEREGMTETGMNFSNPIDGIKKPGSIGQPLPGLEVKIVNPQTLQTLMTGATGEIWLKSPSIIRSYWRKPEDTTIAFAGGWFKTGDLGYVDEEGYYHITDRIKHIIISGGENVSPKEVEAIINRMEAISESSVVGISDEKWGERVVAAIVLHLDATLTNDEIMAHCRHYLHPWKCPKEVVIIDQLPRNSMGKVLKEEVKLLFQQ